MRKKTKINLKARIKQMFSMWAIGLLLSFGLLGNQTAFAQEIKTSGTVTDGGNGSTLPGVSIFVKGTTLGTITDFDGNYEISAAKGSILVFSYVGYVDQEIVLENQNTINVSLKTDLVGLDEVVVIGYGVQKKKLNTGATVNVKGDDIQKLNTLSPMDALKGNVAGVNITANSGVPGAGAEVIIRGAGTMGDASPLYVVDGVSVGNIDFLSPSDIASIDILKDAASTAIYGSRAANGVILVTTKKGKMSDKPTVSYDTYFGWQQVAKRPGLVGAKTYMELMEEAYAYDGRTIDWAAQTDLDYWEEYRNGSREGVQWFDAMYNENAPTQSHALNVTGGNKKSNYSLGFSYLKQQGIIGFADNSTYKRLNARINSDHVIIEVNNRAILKIGENFSYSNHSKPNIATGNIYWNDLHNAIVTNPLMPMYADESTEELYGKYHQPLDWAALSSNPIAVMDINRRTTENSNNNLLGSVYAEIQPIANLKLRSSYGFDASFGDSRNYRPAFQLSAESYDYKDLVSQSMYQNYEWTLTNTASYNLNIEGNHNITAMLGQEARKRTKQLNLYMENDSSYYKDWEHAYISNTHENYQYPGTKISGVNGDVDPLKNSLNYAMLSYFGRVSYDYNETFLATFVYRADASNNLAPGHQWDDFMSLSLGYILSNHAFTSAIPGLNYLKVRGGWGQNGNERIGGYQYSANLVNAGGSYFFGNDKSVITSGAHPSLNPNPNISWEVSEQTSIGFDAHFLDNRLQYNFDWYNKATKNWLVKVPKPLSNGTLGAIENGGAVSNTGVEMSVHWTENLGEFKYSAGVNFAYNKNEVTELATAEGYFNGPESVLNQGSKSVNRVEVGYPIGYFRGLEVSGVIQEGEEHLYAKPDTLDADGNPIPYFKKQQAGDLMFVDQNGDGVIDDEDKVMIGNPAPDVTLGFNVSADYKGFYMAVAANCALGHQIAMSYRPGSKGNFTEYHLDRWTPENQSNTMPRLTASSAHRNYLEVSEYYIHDADFLRISNITIGYDINRLFANSPISEARVYVTGQNLFTFTNYPGMDPEVGYGGDNTPWGSGIDLGLYPQSKTYMIGLSLKF